MSKMKRQHSNSLLQDGKYCYRTGSRFALDRHHILGGPFRDKSEKYGLWVYLDHNVHMWLHSTMQGQAYSRYLKVKAQQAFEEKYDHALWMKEFKKNYL